MPESVDSVQLREHVRTLGGEAFIVHPAYVEDIFKGVTTSVVSAIESLYCDRLGRSITTVQSILRAMARQAGAPALHNEAVWAICTYLANRRQDRASVLCSPTDDRWSVKAFRPDIELSDMPGTSYRPVTAYVVSETNGQILAHRTALPHSQEQTVALALYDALAQQRHPSRDGVDGLEWFVPVTIRLLTPSTGYWLENAFAELPIMIETNQDPNTLPATNTEEQILASWYSQLQRRRISAREFQGFLDNYLFRIQGFGPIRRRKERSEDLSHFQGYSRDPGSVFPALRKLLPPYPGQISDGAVEFNNLHYKHELLSLWEHERVKLRPSQEAESRAWIYLDDDVLCEANAVELRRSDGTYRPDRPGV